MSLISVLISYSQSDFQAAAGKTREADGGGFGAEAVQQVLLPLSAVEPLLKVFNVYEFPMLSMSAVNSGLLAVQGLPREKLEGLLASHFTQYPMSLDDFLIFVVPGPVLAGDMKRDAEKYGVVLKQLRISHPEIAWYQPKEFDAFMQSEEGWLKLLEIQEQNGRAISLNKLLDVSTAKTPKGERGKTASD